MVCTVGKMQKKIEEYIANQLQSDLEYDQMTLKEYIAFTGETVNRNKALVVLTLKGYWSLKTHRNRFAKRNIIYLQRAYLYLLRFTGSPVNGSMYSFSDI